MAERIIDGTKFDVNDIMYTSPKLTGPAKSVNILNKKTKTGLVLSAPLMLTWGAGQYVNDQGVGDNKWTVSLQFPGKEYASPETDAFLRNMQALDERIQNDALINSKEWFGKVHKSAEVIRELYNPMLKYTKDKSTGEYDYNKPPTLRVKLSQWEEVWKFEVYDEDGWKLYPNTNNVSPIEYLKKGTNIMTLIQFAGIWFVNGKFSASWKLVQAVVQKPKPTLQGQCFLRINKEDKEKLKTQVVPEEVDDLHIASTIVDDSDNEEELLAVPQAQVQVQVQTPVVQQPTQPQVQTQSIPVPAPGQVETDSTPAPKKRIVKKKDA